MNVSAQAGSTVYLNCRISLLQDKTVSPAHTIIFFSHFEQYCFYHVVYLRICVWLLSWCDWTGYLAPPGSFSPTNANACACNHDLWCRCRGWNVNRTTRIYNCSPLACRRTAVMHGLASSFNIRIIGDWELSIQIKLMKVSTKCWLI